MPTNLEEAQGVHTPTPWSIAHGCDQYISADGLWIASTMGVRGETGAANARFIVTAVNSHDAALAALRGWQKLHADMVEAGGDLGCLPDGLIDRFALVQSELMEKTDAAIQLAEGR